MSGLSRLMYAIVNYRLLNSEAQRFTLHRRCYSSNLASLGQSMLYTNCLKIAAVIRVILVPSVSNSLSRYHRFLSGISRRRAWQSVHEWFA